MTYDASLEDQVSMNFDVNGQIHRKNHINAHEWSAELLILLHVFVDAAWKDVCVIPTQSKLIHVVVTPFPVIFGGSNNLKTTYEGFHSLELT